MTSPLVQFFENVNLSSSYDGLSPYQIWFDLEEGKQSYREGRNPLPPQVENVLSRPGEIGLIALTPLTSSKTHEPELRMITRDCYSKYKASF